MGGINGFVASFCTVCIILGGMQLLCPQGKLEKSVRYVFALLFLLCVFSSALGIRNLKLTLPSFTAEMADTSGMSTAAARYAYERVLENAGINFSEITVCTDISEDGSISISKLIIVSKDDSQKVRDALGEADANIEVEILNE